MPQIVYVQPDGSRESVTSARSARIAHAFGAAFAQRLRAEMENEALTPEEDATIGKLIQDIFARRFPQ